MIILFAGEKGGTGKSTMAVIQAAHRACTGRDVLLVDADHQQSTRQWAEVRMQEKVVPPISCIALYGSTVAEQIRSLASKYDDIVVDARGADGPELRSAMLAADMIVTPGRPSQFDIFTLATMDRLVADARGFNPTLQARILVNMASTHAQSSEADEMREACGDLRNYQVLETTVKERKAYRLCARDGLGCHEFVRPDEKAVFEMDMLAREIWR